jgi:hypothetical protein
VKLVLEYAVYPDPGIITEIGPYNAPTGIETDRLSVVDEPASTVALVAPKKTVLLPGVASKFEPAIVTVVVLPGMPDSGANDVITGGGPFTLMARVVVTGPQPRVDVAE